MRKTSKAAIVGDIALQQHSARQRNLSMHVASSCTPSKYSSRGRCMPTRGSCSASKPCSLTNGAYRRRGYCTHCTLLETPIAVSRGRSAAATRREAKVHTDTSVEPIVTRPTAATLDKAAPACHHRIRLATTVPGKDACPREAPAASGPLSGRLHLHEAEQANAAQERCLFALRGSDRCRVAYSLMAGKKGRRGKEKRAEPRTCTLYRRFTPFVEIAKLAS